MDTIELDFLDGMQQKRMAALRVNEQQAWGLKSLMAGVNRMTAAMIPATAPKTALDVAAASTPASVDTPTLGGGLGAMVNRSPTTINNYYPQAAADPIPAPVVAPTPMPTPAPDQPASGLSPWWLLAIPAALMIAGATYLLWPKPATPTKPGGESADTTIQLRDWPK